MAAVDPAYGYDAPGAAGARPAAGPEQPAAGRTAGRAASREGPRRSGLVELHGLIDDVRAAAQARARLFALETRRAGLALAQMLMFAVIGALLVLTAWFALVAAAVAFAVSMGASLWWVLLVAVAVNVAIAAVLFAGVRQRVGDLKMNATLRHLGRVRPRPAPPEADTTAAQRAARTQDRAQAEAQAEAARRPQERVVPPRTAESADAPVAAVPLGER